MYHLALVPKSQASALTIIDILQRNKPYFLRYIDRRSIDWDILEESEIKELLHQYHKLMNKNQNKTQTILELTEIFQRGPFAIRNILKQYDKTD